MERIWRATINSWNGLLAVTRSEAAFRQELVLLAIGVLVFLLIVELLNTAIEKLSDRVTRKHDPVIKRVKDMSSAAVGLSLLAAGAVWIWAAVERFWG